MADEEVHSHMHSTGKILVEMTTQLMENVTSMLHHHHDDHHGHHDDGHIAVNDDHHDGHHGVSYIPWNNPDNVISQDQSELGTTIIDCCLVPPVVVFGLVGNFITLAVFLRQGVKERTNICLLGLAISDTLFLVTTYMEKMACIATRIDEVVGKNWASLLHPQGYYISVFFGRVTSVLTMVIALERCVIILRPLKAKTWLTAKFMRLTVLAVYITVALLIIPMFWVYTTRSEFDPIVNRTRVHLETTDAFNIHHQAFECYGDVALNIVLRQVPCYMVMLSTICIICTLRRHQRWRSEKSGQEQNGQERKVTKMLVAISCLYVCCLMPGNVLMIVRHVIIDIHHGRRHHNLSVVLSAANVFTEIINSSFNFVIYMAMSQKFATTFKKMFGLSSGTPSGGKTDTSSSNRTMESVVAKDSSEIGQSGALP